MAGCAATAPDIAGEGAGAGASAKAALAAKPDTGSSDYVCTPGELLGGRYRVLWQCEAALGGRLAVVEGVFKEQYR